MKGRVPISLEEHKLAGTKPYKSHKAVVNAGLSVNESIAVETLPTPDTLKGFAREEWERVTPILINIGVITSLDVHLLETWCITLQRYHDLCKHIDALSDPFSEENNRLHILQSRLANDLRKIGNEFGFTIASRTRLLLSSGTHISKQPEQKSTDRFF